MATSQSAPATCQDQQTADVEREKNNYSYDIPFCQTQYRQMSFFLRTIPDWNSLLQEMWQLTLWTASRLVFRQPESETVQLCLMFNTKQISLMHEYMFCYCCFLGGGGCIVSFKHRHLSFNLCFRCLSIYVFWCVFFLDLGGLYC